jgi:hypothetical protein
MGFASPKYSKAGGSGFMQIEGETTSLQIQRGPELMDS